MMGSHGSTRERIWCCVTALLLMSGTACLPCCVQGFLAEGLQRTGAGLGSVIIDSQPLSVAVLAALLFGERLSPVGILGKPRGGGCCEQPSGAA